MKTKRMNKLVKKLWVAALRSGKYKQGKGQLKTDRGYCCLGVLEDLYIRHELPRVVSELKWGEKLDELYMPGSGGEYVLNRPVMEWSGLGIENPLVTVRNVPRELAQLNDEGTIETDDKRLSFNQIANLIEKQM